MTALEPIDFAAGLHQDRWSRLTPGSAKLNSNTEVWGPANTYTFESGLQVTINATRGPTVRLRYCGGGDFDCNFLRNESLLTAADPDNVVSPDHAPSG